jgi:hypothetical protein
MDKRAPLITAGVLFSLIAFIHLLRYLYRWEVSIAGQTIPMSVSIVALIVGTILALWMFYAAR